MSAELSFETLRLSVAPWAGDCARAGFRSSLSALLTQDVLEHLPPSLAFDPGRDDIRMWIKARDRLTNVHSVRLRSDHTLIGLFFAFQPEEQTVAPLNIGYLLGKDFWGQGYASELTQGACAALAGQDLMAGVSKDNPASARVLLKSGFDLQSENESGAYYLRRG